MKYAIRQITRTDGEMMHHIYINPIDTKNNLNDIFKRLVEVFDVWIGNTAEFDVVEVEK